MDDNTKYCTSDDPCIYRESPRDKTPYDYPCKSMNFCSSQRFPAIQDKGVDIGRRIGLQEFYGYIRPFIDVGYADNIVTITLDKRDWEVQLKKWGFL